MILTRDEAIPVLARVTIALVTSTVRDHPAEVPLARDHGLDHESVVNCDDIATVSKSQLARRRGALAGADVRRLDTALVTALGIEYV